MSVVLYIAMAVTVFLLVALLTAPIILGPSPAAKRILELVQSTRPDQRRVSNKERVEDAILALARTLRSFMGSGEDDAQRQRLLSAGIKTQQGRNAYFVCRVMVPITGIALGSMIPRNTVFWALCLGCVGYLAPDIWLTTRVKKRRDTIRKSLPDALDLLVICVEAGLGLDQAMLRVGQELSISHPEINKEFTQINLEQHAGKARLDAWKSAADRTQIQEFSLFVTMLMQADKFGTPIIRALSRFADEIRLKRRQGVEEKAAKTKVKILFPLVLFIFPTIFIVLLAPAVLNIAKNMQSFK